MKIRECVNLKKKIIDIQIETCPFIETFFALHEFIQYREILQTDLKRQLALLRKQTYMEYGVIFSV